VKPPRFEYQAPASLDEALGLLTEHQGEARPLAGGQSLLPLLNFRLAQPSALIDLNRIPSLAGIATDGPSLSVGAMTRTAQLITEDIARTYPILAAAARLVGHPQIRARGTVGGSLAHADPAAELPAVALLLDATVRLQGPGGRRDVRAVDFFEGLFSTACAWDELVAGVLFPPIARDTGWGFREFARRPGDFALAGVGTLLALEGGVIASIRIVAFGVGVVPLRANAAEGVLLQNSPDVDVLAAARDAIAEEVAPSGSLHGSSDYRRHLTGVLLERSVEDALQSMRSTGNASS
jgi:carbon-monoxide dehydrogenase medium subunit